MFDTALFICRDRIMNHGHDVEINHSVFRMIDLRSIFFVLLLKSLFSSDNKDPSGTIHSPSLARCTAHGLRKRHLSQMYHDYVCVAVCIIHFVFETEGINE